MESEELKGLKKKVVSKKLRKKKDKNNMKEGGRGSG